jgi:hypothetical protein
MSSAPQPADDWQLPPSWQARLPGHRAGLIVQLPAMLQAPVVSVPFEQVGVPQAMADPGYAHAPEPSQEVAPQAPLMMHPPVQQCSPPAGP